MHRSLPTSMRCTAPKVYESSDDSMSGSLHMSGATAARCMLAESTTCCKTSHLNLKLCDQLWRAQMHAPLPHLQEFQHAAIPADDNEAAILNVHSVLILPRVNIEAGADCAAHNLHRQLHIWLARRLELKGVEGAWPACKCPHLHVHICVTPENDDPATCSIIESCSSKTIQARYARLMRTQR